MIGRVPLWPGRPLDRKATLGQRQGNRSRKDRPTFSKPGELIEGSLLTTVCVAGQAPQRTQSVSAPPGTFPARSKRAQCHNARIPVRLRARNWQAKPSAQRPPRYHRRRGRLGAKNLPIPRISYLDEGHGQQQGNHEDLIRCTPARRIHLPFQPLDEPRRNPQRWHRAASSRQR